MNIQNKPWMSEEETNLILSLINKNDIFLRLAPLETLVQNNT